MIYRGYTIQAEAITGRTVFNLNEDGTLGTPDRNIDTIPEIDCYEVTNDKDPDFVEWTSTKEEARQLIDEHIKKYGNE